MTLRHRAKITAVALLIVLVAGAAGVAIFTARLFVWPPQSTPRHSDAVVVLAGDHGERLARGLILMRQGLAPTLVLAGNPDSAQARDLCSSREPFEVVCLPLTPDGTRYEARAAGRLAADRGWKKMTVVTTTFHVSRAGVLFGRCFDGRLDMVGAQPPYSFRSKVDAVVHEWLGLVYAETVARGC